MKTVTETLRIRIIELLSKDLDTFYSISDIAKKLKVAYSHAHSFVQDLAKQNIIEIQKIGNVSVVKLNLKEQMTLAQLTIAEYRKSAEWKKKNPHSEKIMEKIEQVKSRVHCVIMKGGKVIIVVPEGMDRSDFGVFRNRLVVSVGEFRSKKYYHDGIILHGAEKFWSLIS